jgi:hypothetical protein
MRQWKVVKRADKSLLPAAAAMKDFLISLGSAMLPALPSTPTVPARPQRPRRPKPTTSRRRAAAQA